MSATSGGDNAGIRFLPAGDTALVVEFGDRIDRALSERVLRLGERIRESALAGVTETVATFRSLLVHYDPLVTGAAAVKEHIADLLDDRAGGPRPRRLFRVPACYDQACAPDLDEVATRAGMSRAEVIEAHCGQDYHVYSIGFLPGYAYMGDVVPALALPRRTDPRVRVPAGSVAIAAGMTGIYPIESPGGWHLIGATAIRLFDPDWPQPSLFRPGDAVRFVPISREDYDRARAAMATEPLQPEASP
ncbi:MAG: 5-oxoprolinase subunit PxpB [Bauldia sp.]